LQNNNATTNGNLFDIRQSPVDGKFRVWVQRSAVQLGMVDMERYEALGRPAFMNPMHWVVAQVYDKKPTVDTVLAELGVKRREKVEGEPAKTNRPRQRKPQAEKAAA
jgi:hypothetical protein